MGNGESKEINSVAPSPSPVNVVITKEVSERWHSIALKSLNQQNVYGYGDSECQVGPRSVLESASPETNLLVEPNTMLEIGQVADQEDLKIHELKKKLALLAKQNQADFVSAALLLLNMAPIESSLRKGPKKLYAIKKTILENVNSNDQLRENSTLFADMGFEGLSLLQGDTDTDNRSSAAIKDNSKSMTMASTSAELGESTLDSLPQLPCCEEDISNLPVKNHMNESKVQLIENLSSQVEPLQSKQVWVPTTRMPFSIDEGNDGTVTQDQNEEELIRNNVHWVKEIDILIKKLEDNTERHAKELERGIKQLEAKYPELITSSTGAPCNALATRIEQCYDKNGMEKLRCHHLVNEFARCTSSYVNATFSKN